MTKRLNSVDWVNKSILDGDETWLYGFTSFAAGGKTNLWRIDAVTAPADGIPIDPELIASFPDEIQCIKLVDADNIVCCTYKSTAPEGKGQLWHMDISGALPVTPTLALTFDVDGQYMLGQDSLQTITYDGGTRVIANTYFTLSGTQPPLPIWMSDDAVGLTGYTKIVEFPANYARHMHCINQAPDGRVWFSIGDGNSAIIIWDTVVAPTWPTFTTYAALNATAGFVVISTETTSITDNHITAINFTFRDGFCYYYSDKYATSNQEERGIWRLPLSITDSTNDSDLPVRVDFTVTTRTGGGNRWGWNIQLLGNHFIATDYLGEQDDDLVTSDYCNFIYASETGDADSWEIIGRINGVERTAPDRLGMSVYAMKVIGNRLYYSCRNMGGKNNGQAVNFNTAIMELSDEDYIVEDSDPFPIPALHPTYFVDEDAANPGNLGKGAVQPAASLAEFLRLNYCTWGSTVMLLSDFEATTYQGGRIVGRWNNMAGDHQTNFDGGQPVTVVGLGRDITTVSQASSATSPGLFYMAEDNHNLVIKNMTVRVDKTASSAYFALDDMHGSLTLKNAIIESLEKTVSLGDTAGFSSYRSRIISPEGANPTFSGVWASPGGDHFIKSNASEFIGGSHSIDIEGDVSGVANTFSVVNTVFDKYNDSAIEIEADMPDFTTKLLANNAFVSDTADSVVDGPAQTWSGTEVNSNWFAGDVPAFADSTKIDISDPGFVSASTGDYRLESDSGLIGVGYSYDNEPHYDFNRVEFTVPLSVGAFEVENNVASTYTIVHPGSGSWGDGMSIETWRANEATLGVDGDVYNFITPQSTGSYLFTSTSSYKITNNNVTINAAAPGGAVVQLLGTDTAGQSFIVEDATGVEFNGLSIANIPTAIEWGTAGGSNTPTGTVNDVIVTGSNDEAFQHYASSSVVYTDCQGNDGDAIGMSVFDSATVVDNGSTYTGNGQGINVSRQGTYTGNAINSTGNTTVHTIVNADIVLGTDSALDIGINVTLNDSTYGNISGISENAAVDITFRGNRNNVLCDNFPVQGTLPYLVRGFVQFGGDTGSAGDVDAIFDSTVIGAPDLNGGDYNSMCYIRGASSNVTKFRNTNFIIDEAKGGATAISAVSGAGVIIENSDFFGMNTGLNCVTGSSADNSAVSNCNFDSDSVTTPFAGTDPAIDVDNTQDPSGYTDVSNINDPDLHPATGSTLITGGNNDFQPEFDIELFVFQSGNRAAFASPQIAGTSLTLTTHSSTMGLLVNAGNTGGVSLFTYANPNIATAQVIAEDFWSSPKFPLNPLDVIWCQLSDGFVKLSMVTETTAEAV